MSYYGDLLAAFPEAIQKHQIFSMKPLPAGGYEPRVNLYKRRGAFIKEARSRVGINGEARVENEAGVLYAFESKLDESIPQGVYFEYNNEVFMIADDQTYAKEAGFAAYSCQLVAGNTDTQVENMEVEDRVVVDYPI